MAKRISVLEFDEIGYWSEVKLSILDEYAKPYNEILHKNNFKTVYIDAFAGAGHHIARGTGEFVQGSPVRALDVQPPFDFLHFVDMDEARTIELKRLSAGRPNVKVHEGDANVILLRDVFLDVKWDQFRRGLCILDPYGLDLDWGVVKAAGEMKTIEIFLNFPVMDINRNVLWNDYEKVGAAQRDRMTRFWGDDSWHAIAYSRTENLFGDSEKVLNSNREISAAFRNRLNQVAGFGFVPEPIPMRNSRGATVYYLFFAAQKPVAANIVTDIFRKYVHKGEK
jgi:three-Cys-motif partner protein